MLHALLNGENRQNSHETVCTNGLATESLHMLEAYKIVGSKMRKETDCMNDFFTWTILATYAGATLATTLVTQLLKGIGFIDRIPTRIFSYVIALIILLVATFFTGALTWDTAALCVVNAVVVSLAANGAFDAVTAKHTNN